MVLNELPASEIEAAEFARKIRKMKQEGDIRAVEGIPVGGTPVTLGNSKVGEMMDAPLPLSSKDPWSIARLHDFSLAQVACALIKGQIWLHGNNASSGRIGICPLKQFATRGPISRDINGEYKGKPRGPFDIRPISEAGVAQTYLCLWEHDCDKERRLVVAPDTYGVVRMGMDARANQIFKRAASRIHYNMNFGFSSQSLAVAFTERAVIGGRAWPSIIISGPAEREMAYALWSNSTLGILLYWWHANKSQPGRGSIAPSQILEFPTIDLRSLSKAQLMTARKGFRLLQSEDMLAFHLAYRCPIRKKLDEVILGDVLGFSQEILDGVAVIRDKLCHEPSILGGKEDERCA